MVENYEESAVTEGVDTELTEAADDLKRLFIGSLFLVVGAAIYLSAGWVLNLIASYTEAGWLDGVVIALLQAASAASFVFLGLARSWNAMYTTWESMKGRAPRNGG